MSTFLYMGMGSILKVTSKYGGHWLIVGSHYTDGFYVYDANWDPVRTSSPYVVRYKQMTYQTFRDTFTINSGGLKP